MTANVNDLNQDTRKDKDFFYFTLPGLEPGEVLPVNLRWQKQDGSRGLWSSAKVLTAPGEANNSLPIPSFSNTDVDKFPGTIIVTWNGKDNSVPPKDLTNVDRVGVFITDANNTFGNGTTEAAFFKSAGRLSIAAPGGTYTVKLASISARGTIGTKTAGVQVVIESAIAIEAPKLAVGLSVSPAPFAITASWGGKYSGDETFTGLKSINIYASETDLGETTTPSASPGLGSNLVGTMTVNDLANKITIGMNVLKQVLSIGNDAHSPTSEELYALPIFFYHVTVNDNGLPYKVNGSTVYTRINSTGISPTKANFIDLAAGTISIENLTAGNGQFQSWLRVGEPGGARIELSSSNVNSSEAGGYDVLSGFTVYESGVYPVGHPNAGKSIPAFRADLSGNVAIGTYTAADIATIETDTADAKTKANSADGKATTAISNAATANSNAALAQSAAAEAFAKTSRFNSDGTEIQLGTQLTKYGAIYSVKTSYANTNTGWWIGNTFSGTEENPVYTPQINIGSDTKYLKWNGSSLEIKGTISADSGFLGTADNGWSIGDSVLKTNSETSSLQFGNTGSIYYIQRNNGQFTIKENDSYILNTAGQSGTDGARIYLGNSTRQIEVVKSAQISGAGSLLTDPNDTSLAGQAYRSGGLRNIYTVASSAWDPGLYPSAGGGDMLVVF